MPDALSSLLVELALHSQTKPGDNSLWCLVKRVDGVCSRRLTVAAPLVCMVLSPRQVKTMQMSCDDDKDSVLIFAARNNSPDVFGAVMSAIENDVTPQEVRENDDSDLTRHMFEGRTHPGQALDVEVNAIDTCARDQAKYAVVVSSEVNRCFIVRSAYRPTNSV